MDRLHTWYSLGRAAALETLALAVSTERTGVSLTTSSSCTTRGEPQRTCFLAFFLLLPSWLLKLAVAVAVVVVVVVVVVEVLALECLGSVLMRGGETSCLDFGLAFGVGVHSMSSTSPLLCFVGVFPFFVFAIFARSD